MQNYSDTVAFIAAMFSSARHCQDDPDFPVPSYFAQIASLQLDKSVDRYGDMRPPFWLLQAGVLVTFYQLTLSVPGLPRTRTDDRGTFGILKSCVITLVLCLYTALHLNIPPGDASTLSLVLRKTKWILVGVFAPKDYCLCGVGPGPARQVTESCKHMADGLKRTEKDPTLKWKHDWTTTRSWFASMGGFAINTKQGQEDLPGDKESIKDRSKADSLARVLVITQASWMILQWIMRLAYKLPVTVLELNTLAHAICALFVYALWWEKPLDVNEPTILTADWAPSLAATLWACSVQRSSSWLSSFDRETVKIDELYWLAPTVAQSILDSCTEMLPLQTAPHCLPLDEQQQQGKNWRKVKARPYSCDDEHHRDQRSMEAFYILIRRFVYDCPDAATLLFEASSAPTSSPRGDAVQLRDPVLPNNSFVQTSTLTIKGLARDSTAQKLARKSNMGHRMARIARSNWPNLVFGGTGNGDDGMKPIIRSMAVFWIAALVYGAIHAAAWNDLFATPTEALLWKISCIYVAGYGCIAMAMVTVLAWIIAIDDNEESRVLRMATKIKDEFSTAWELVPLPIRTIALWFLLAVGIAVPIGSNLFCRLFLVIEAFISLRRQPAKAFQTPNYWTQYLAHFKELFFLADLWR
ncbi:hypothetical protein B0H66DRAFT_604341 [Apodospora peruviana]|uniref:Uncharacterized protein n=1 Tax=Apodospora peruviana TaxID=516989 RepID=A0AAE0HZW4_9PEZI|nr:hypothetical protein B0H66DRAFT_604341 [Apodospora peruviana]